MKITDVEALYLRLPEIQQRTDSSQDALLIKVSTDAGITGWGEVDGCPWVVKAIVEAPYSHTLVTGLKSLLIGEDPMDTGRLWNKMYQSTLYYGRQGAVVQAMAGIDLALWDISLMTQSVLKPESYKQMFTEVKLKNGQGTHYGLGVEVLNRNGHRDIEHSGEVTGFVSDNVVYVDDGVAVAVLTNHMESGASQIADLAAETVLGERRSPTEEQALNIYRGLQKGQIDRSLLAPNLSDYFSAQALSDFKDSLGPLGEPLTFRQTGEMLRGGMTFRGYRVIYPTRGLRITTYTYPDGKLEQYLVGPAD